MRLSVLLLALAGLLTPGLSCDGVLYSGQAEADCDVSEVTTATVTF